MELIFEGESFDAHAFKCLVVAFLECGGVFDDVAVWGDCKGVGGQFEGVSGVHVDYCYFVALV